MYWFAKKKEAWTKRVIQIIRFYGKLEAIVDFYEKP